MGDPEEAVLLLSDLHIGRRSASYNKERFWRRLQQTVDTVKELLLYHQTIYPVETLNILFLGDIVQGERVDKQMTLDELEFSVEEQLATFAQAAAYLQQRAFAKLVDVKMYGVPGNHGIQGGSIKTSTNWDTVAYKMVGGIAIPEHGDDYMTAPVNGKNILMKHGHGIPMTNTVPYYGVTTRALRWKQSIPAPWEILVMGHFHTMAFLSFNTVPIFMNGTFVSDDEYTRSKMGLEGDTKQWLFGVHPRVGITWTYRINLQKGEA